MGWVRSIVQLVTVLPISIGGLGVREGALVLTLAWFGVADHDALALAILVFATTILAPGFVGACSRACVGCVGSEPADAASAPFT